MKYKFANQLSNSFYSIAQNERDSKSIVVDPNLSTSKDEQGKLKLNILIFDLGIVLINPTLDALCFLHFFFIHAP